MWYLGARNVNKQHKLPVQAALLLAFGVVRYSTQPGERLWST